MLRALSVIYLNIETMGGITKVKKALIISVLGMAMSISYALAQPEQRNVNDAPGSGAAPAPSTPDPASTEAQSGVNGAPDSGAGQAATPSANKESAGTEAGAAGGAQRPVEPENKTAAGEEGQSNVNGAPDSGAGQAATPPANKESAGTEAGAAGGAQRPVEPENKTAASKEAQPGVDDAPDSGAGQSYLLWVVIAGGVLLLILTLVWAQQRSLSREREARARAEARAQEAAAARADLEARTVRQARAAAVPNTPLPAGYKIRGGRDYQEDAFQIKSYRAGDSNVLLLILADGMGGHVGGARASELAVATFVGHFGRAEGATAGRLRESLDAANNAIADAAAADLRLSGMGCTVVACLVDGDQAHWISVGDSLLWCLRDGQLFRLNADHSMRPVLEDMVELGRMTQAELEEDPRLGQLRSVVTGEELTLVDQNEQPFTLQPEDRLLLASDGLEALSDAEIADLAASRDEPADSVNALLDAIQDLGRPGQDNTTVVVYRRPAEGG